MNKAKLTERFTAILALQDKQKQYQSVNYWSDIYEKATDLALNPLRKVDEFFMRNLIRDAKRILNRRKENSIFQEVPKVDPESNLDPFENLLVHKVTPEHQLIYSNLIDQIKATCPVIHEHAEVVFQGMIDGETSVTIAKELGISESLVKKIRLEIKSLVQSIILN